jgi:FKBP-type peptidyl-prolyl cis-trans isomerase FkpA
MKKAAFLISLALIIGFASCRKADRGFKEHSSGLSYKFFEMNPEGATPQPGDLIVMSIRITTREGKLIDESNYYRMQLLKPMYKGDIYTALSLAQVGDSICFKLDAAGYYEKNRKRDLPVEFQQGDPVYIYIRLKNIISTQDLEQEITSVYHSDREQEMNLLRDYIALTNTTVKPSPTGLYYIEKTRGTGPKAQPGKELTVHYTGTTIDGKIFDSSIQRGRPLRFVLGQGEVIKGWDEGFLNMQAGGKARFIIPSDLAYGKEGYSNIILPYSTLVFEVELLDVK